MGARKTLVLAGLLLQASWGYAGVTVFYDFESNLFDAVGAGINADDLVLKGGCLDTNVPANAKGSTLSYKFANFGASGYQTAQTDGWSADLAGGNAYTVMFWYKGDEEIQNNNNTRLVTVRFKPDGSGAPAPAFQVEGFGRSGGNPDQMDMRLNDPVATNLWFSPDAVGVFGPAGGVNDDGNPNNDEWHHVAFIFSNSNSPSGVGAYAATYVDGVFRGLANEPLSTGNPIGNREGELILGGVASYDRSATGSFDDFAIWDEVVSSNDIFAIAAGVASPADFLPPQSNDPPAFVVCTEPPAPTITVYYDFEGDYNDAPGAGVNADDLVTVTGGMLVNDTPGSALGSTMAYRFQNLSNRYQAAQTDAWSPDLASGNAYTVMFWWKGDNQIQNNNNTRLITVRHKEGGGSAADPTLQVEGFGLGGQMDMRLNDVARTNLWFSPHAIGAFGGSNNDGIQGNDEWHHVVFIFDNTAPGGGVAVTYVDGVFAGAATEPLSAGSSIGNTEGELIIGGHNVYNRSATGLLDDVALFDGVVTSNDIYAIANGLKSPADFLSGAAPDLVLTKTAVPPLITIQANLAYLIQVINSSTVTLSSVTVTDALPAEVAFVQSIPPASQTNGRDYVFSFGSLLPGSVTSIWISTVITSPVPGVVTNYAVAATTNDESSTANNWDTAVVILGDLDGDGINNPLDPDADGDAVLNIHEVIANTDPLNATSFLWLAIGRTATQAVYVLAFPSSTNRVYAIESAADYRAGPWLDWRTNIPGDGTVQMFSASNPANQGYFRIRVESP